MDTRRITVNTSCSYDVVIGKSLLADCADYIKNTVKSTNFAVITDDNVDRFYGDIVIKSLTSCGFSVVKFIFPHGEASKCSDTLNQIYDFLSNNHITRTDCIIALGGGVVGDITGFAAATYLRGLDYIQIPTSLLAQVDSSVGGKTAIDLPCGKNLVGAFKQPKLVLCDTSALSTLPNEYLIDGMGEVVKYGMIKSASLFETLEENDIDSIWGVLDDVIYECVSIKRDVVVDDEFDKGDRMLLNFGHTLGHSIEKYYNFTGISHGVAVAVGMRIITDIAEKSKLSVSGLAARLTACLGKYCLNAAIEPTIPELADACLNDKKRESDFISIIICEDVGTSSIKKMPVPEFLKLLS